MDEKALIHKLLTTGHLNVFERRWLPDGKARFQMLCEEFEDILQSGEWIHAWWMPDDSMFGCTIELRGDGPGTVLRKDSCLEGERITPLSFASTREAARSFVLEFRELIGNDLDGVPVVWSA